MTAPQAELKEDKHVEAMSGYFETFQNSLCLPSASSAPASLTMEPSKSRHAGAFQLSISCFTSFPINNFWPVCVFKVR